MQLINLILSIITINSFLIDSKTTLTPYNLDTINNDKVGSSSSKMKNMGQYYIENQNTYGTNALLM